MYTIYYAINKFTCRYSTDLKEIYYRYRFWQIKITNIDIMESTMYKEKYFQNYSLKWTKLYRLFYPAGRQL